jgi:catechol 2,3-dioxygenase-like lactoylglutathione lyase family enzyme
MKLGAFSVSLAVKDLAASKIFYEKLGFKQIHGVIEQNWVILQNEGTTIGLFQGMFEKNIMTFNPGWDVNQQTPENFTDVRDLQAKLLAQDIELQTKADAGSSGPASFTLVDPDGNTILFDQHVDKPE